MTEPRLTHIPDGPVVISHRLAGRRPVALAFWLPAGPLFERDSEAGLSHLLEHMCFKGTERRTARDIALEMEAVGADWDAFTEREHTCYHVTVLGEHLERAVDVFSDMLQSSRLRADDLQIERNVVLEEIGHYEDSPEERVHDAVLATLWAGHPLARPIHGRAEVIAAVSRRKLAAFAQVHYVPARTVVVAAGNVEHERLADMVAERYQTGRAAKAIPAPPPPKPRRGQALEEDDTEQAYMCLASPGSTQTDEDRYAEMVLACALGGGASSRLFQTIREERGLAYNVGCYAAGMANAGVIVAHAATTARQVPEVLRLIRNELSALTAEGLPEPELARTKQQLVSDLHLAMDSLSSQAFRLAHSHLYFGRVRPWEETIRGIGAVTGDQMADCVRARFDNGPWALAIIGRLEEGRLLTEGE
jgi:predicted Zn-dependent peptidase